VVNRNSYKTEGLVLKRTNFAEADKIITFFTKDRGKIVCLAKGIRRMTSRKRGSLEIFNRVSFSAVSGKGLDLVTEAEILDSYSSLRKDLKKVAAVYEIAEILDRLTPENTEQEEVYDLLAISLENISQSVPEKLKNLINDFGVELLKLLGFWPKDKNFPSSFSVSSYVEKIIERDLKSRRFLDKL